MKSLKLILAAIATLFIFTSCEKEEHPIIEEEVGPNLALEVAGSYLGSILHNDTLFLDYEVTVEAVGHNKVRCEGQDGKLPAFTQSIVEAPEYVKEDWIVQPNTFQI